MATTTDKSTKGGRGGTYPITGILENTPVGPRGPVPLRRDVDEWYTDSNAKLQHSLFFRAMTEFQKLPVDDFRSYYQVAGIHGQPMVSWNEETHTQSPGHGYCPHMTILFPTWHRPYMLLFEQRIYELMVDSIIPQYPPKLASDLFEAAKSWRFPYWDWAARKSRHGEKPDLVVPLIVLEEEVEVIDFKSEDGQKLIKIPNPMYHFTTDKPMGDYGENRLTALPGKDDATYEYDKAKSTSRGIKQYSEVPKEQWVNGVQDNDNVTKHLREFTWEDHQGFYHPLVDCVHRLLIEESFLIYDEFASTRYRKGKPNEFLSLEMVHNNIHLICGQDGGHMVKVPVAAFDPIFWLHHCNVDRILALWQALNPHSWFPPENDLNDEGGNWSTKKNTRLGSQWPLAPFHKADGTYFTSNDTYNWIKYGHSYPELQPWLDRYWKGEVFNQELYTGDIKQAVNKLYGSGRTKLLISASQQDTDQVQQEDYVVNILYERFALHGNPFVVTIYIGEAREPEFAVGNVYNFSTPSDTTGLEGGCQNCIQQERTRAISTGLVPITVPLLREIEAQRLASLKKHDVTEYLKTKLHWKVTALDGSEILPDKVGLQVIVALGSATHYTDIRKTSDYGGYRHLTHITSGNPGGYTMLPPPAAVY